MSSWDIISDLMDYTEKEYPDIDIRISEKKYRKRVYEQTIIEIIIDHLCQRMFNDPIDIVENYEISYVYLVKIYGRTTDIYKIQLNVIKKILMFLRERFARYG